MKHDPAAQRRFAVQVVAQLRDAGHLAYWAGGCVRDELLGRTPKDYDVATDARPERIRALFGERRTLAVGESFGVIVVLGPKAAGSVEVATFRRDVAYSDGRRPDAVAFTDAEEDARRRDFTMNALFMDPIDNRVLDYVGGQEDLRRRIVRAVGDAHARFREDKLRMLRAVRMAATFHFSLDGDTLAAVRSSAREVTVVSPERIAQELRGMFGKPGQAEAARLLVATGLAEPIVPEILPLATLRDAAGRSYWDRTIAVLHELETHGPASFALGVAALLHAAGRAEGAKDDDEASHGAEIVRRAAHRWRLSNAERDHAAWLVRHQFGLRDAARRPWSQVQPLLVGRWAADLIALTAATAKVERRGDDDEAFCRGKLALPRNVLDPPPLVTGDDLQAAGMRPGPEFARLLAETRAAQLDGLIRTRDEGLARARQSSDGGRPPAQS